MDLQELAQNIKAIRDEAKHRWGISYEDNLANGRVDDAINYGAGWQYHLQQLLFSDDPEQYLIDNPGETK